MKCPVDGAILVLADRSGIEIDYCPDCRGVWLDRGELDKIIDRSFSQAPETYGPVPPPQQPYPQGGYDKHGSGRGSSGHGSRSGHGSAQQYGNGKRRGGWLGELFGD